MLPGYNHNIKYKGTIYHVQTEDNGVDNPYIITHIFIGGNILATKKASYQDIATNENAQQLIQQLMQDQHKAMVKELVSGALDDRLSGAIAPPTTPAPATKTGAKSTTTPAMPLDLEANRPAEKSLDDIILEYLSKEKH